MTITGGKWTSYRLMAEDTVDKAIEVAKGLPVRKCVTKKLRIHGYRKNPNLADHMRLRFGRAEDPPNLIKTRRWASSLRSSATRLPRWFGPCARDGPHGRDVLARRVRLLFVDAREAMAAAPKVAETMARELGRDQAWIDAQVESFTKLWRKNYIFEA